MPGPNDDWLDSAAVDRFFAAEWKVQAKSNRTGIRLTGPEFTFSERALHKRPNMAAIRPTSSTTAIRLARSTWRARRRSF